jgi:hypothetical protein
VRLDVVPARSFDGTSRVSAYWLANCEGFRVRRGRRRGVVRDVALDAATGRTEYLVVRFGLRRIVVHIDDVETVVPARELLVLRRRARRAPSLAPAARRARTAATRGARAGGRLGRRAGSATARTIVGLAATTAHGTRRLAAWLAPRATLVARACARAAAAALVLAMLALARAGLMLQALRAAALARLRAGRPGHGTGPGPSGAADDARPAPEPGHARHHAA